MLGVGGPTKDLRCLGACQNISELVVEYPPLRMGVKYQCARHGCQCSTRNHQLWSKSFQRLPTDCGAWAPKDELGQPWKLRLAADLQYKSRKLCHKCAKIWKEQQTDAPASTRPATREAPKPPPPTKGPGRQKDEGFILGSSCKGSSDKSRLVEQGTLAQKRYERWRSRAMASPWCPNQEMETVKFAVWRTRSTQIPAYTHSYGNRCWLLFWHGPMSLMHFVPGRGGYPHT